MPRRRAKSMVEASHSPPPTPIARATRSRKSLALPLLSGTQSLAMAPEQGSTVGQRRSSRSAPKRGEGLALSPTTGMGPMMTRGKQARDEREGRDRYHDDVEAPQRRWRSPEQTLRQAAMSPQIFDGACEVDEESLLGEVGKGDEEHPDAERQDDEDDDDDDDDDDGNEDGPKDEGEGNAPPDPSSVNSSPGNQGSYASSLNGGDRMPSPSASRHYDASSSAAKRRRKKPRNPHISPNKQRQLRRKQKEREERRKGDVVSSPVSAAGSGSGTFPPPSSPPVPVKIGAAPPPPTDPPEANTAFEEDFGLLLRSGMVLQAVNERPDTLIDATATFLLRTAMGGFSEDEDSQRVAKREGAEIEGVTIVPGIRDDINDFPTQSVDDSPLTTATNNAIAESPSHQLLAELQKNGDEVATESTLSRQESPVNVGAPTPVVATVNGATDSRHTQVISDRTSHASPIREIENSPTREVPEKDILDISFGRRLSLGPSDTGISSKGIMNEDTTIRSREGNTRLAVRDGPPTPRLEHNTKIEISSADSPTKTISPRERIDIRARMDNQDGRSSDCTTEEEVRAASTLSQMTHLNNIVSTFGRKRSHSEISSRDRESSPGHQVPLYNLSCPTCLITLEKILDHLKKNVADLRLGPEEFMEKHRQLCTKYFQDESLISEGETEDGSESGDYDEEDYDDDGEEYEAEEELGEEEDGVDDEEKMMDEEEEEENLTAASKMVAALRKLAELLPGYLGIKNEDVDKEIEIRRSAISSGQLPEGKPVEDILFLPLMPISTFQAYLDKVDTPAERFLVEERIVEALADIQVEYLMIDEIIRRKEARTPDRETVVASRASRGRKKGKPKVVRNPLEPEDPIIWEDKKEAELYGFSYDPAIDKRGKQNADEQQAGKYSIRGRELRSRQKAVELVLYPGYEHVDQRTQTLQPKLTRRRKPIAEKEKGGDSLEQLRAGSAPPPVSVAPQKKRPGRPPKNTLAVSLLSAVTKDQASAPGLSGTHPADNVVRPKAGEKPKVDPNSTPPNSICGTVEGSPSTLRFRFSGARHAEFRNIVSQVSVRRDFNNRPGSSSLGPAITQSEPVSPTRFYPERNTRQSDSFMSLMDSSISGQRSESPVYDSAAESNSGDPECRGRSRPRGRGRTRGRIRGTRGPGRPPRGSGLRVETSSAANSVGRGEPSSANPETPTLSAECSEADYATSAASDRGHNYHSNSLRVPLQAPGSSTKRTVPAVMRFNSTPSPMFTVFPSRSSGPQTHPASTPISTSPSYHDPNPTHNRPSTESDHGGKPRVRGKTYKTPISVSLAEIKPKTTKEEEFIAAQNGNLGKRKRVKTALAYEAPRRKSRVVAGREGTAGGGGEGSVSGEREDESESSEPDDDDSGGYGNRR